MWAELVARQELSRVLACRLQSEVDEYLLNVQERPEQSLKCPRVARRAGRDEELCRGGKSNRHRQNRGHVCVVWVGMTKSQSRTRLSVIQDSSSFLQAQIGKSRVSGEGRPPTTSTLRSWQGGFFFCTVHSTLFPPAQATWLRGRPFGHTATQKRGRA